MQNADVNVEQGQELVYLKYLHQNMYLLTKVKFKSMETLHFQGSNFVKWRL